jgi:hypothetical protein
MAFIPYGEAIRRIQRQRVTNCESMNNFFKDFQVATDETCSFAWAAAPNGKLFFCAFCGRKFVPGDEYRAIFTNDLPSASGNPLTCKSCFDTHGGVDGLRNRWTAIWHEYRTKFKYFYERSHR